MNNSDMPAAPCQGSIDRNSDEAVPYQFGNNDFVFPGLTKREYFAGLAMQAVIMGRPNIDYDEASHHAVHHADMLLEDLESTK